MKALLVLMVFVYIAGSRYMATVTHRAQSSLVDTSDDQKRVKKFKTAIALAVFAKFALVIGVFTIFFLHYQTLRHWVGSVCFLIGMETLWAGYSMLQSAHTRALRTNHSTDRALELFEKTSSSLKSILGPFLSSGVLLVAVTVFLFFNTKLHLYLSFWDLAGVIFFLASNELWFVLYIRYRDVTVGKLRKAIPPLGANVVPKHPDTP